MPTQRAKRGTLERRLAVMSSIYKSTKLRCQGGYVSPVSICWLFRQQDYKKKKKKPRIDPINFGADPDEGTDPEYFSHFLQLSFNVFIDFSGNNARMLMTIWI